MTFPNMPWCFVAGLACSAPVAPSPGAPNRMMMSSHNTISGAAFVFAALLGVLPLIREAVAAVSATPTGTPFIETISWHPRTFVHHGIITEAEALELKRGNQAVQDDLRFRIAQWAFVPLANIGKASPGLRFRAPFAFFGSVFKLNTRNRMRLATCDDSGVSRLRYCLFTKRARQTFWAITTRGTID